MVKTASGSLFTCLVLATETGADLAELDMIWDSVALRHDSFGFPDDLLRETPKATLQPEGQGYSLRYPQAWQAVASERSVFVSDPENPVFLIYVAKSQRLEASIDEVVTDALRALGVFDDVTLLSEHKVLLPQAEHAVMLEGTARFEDGSDAVFKTLLVLTRESTYKVEVVAEEANWGLLFPVFEQVFDSFTLLPD